MGAQQEGAKPAGHGEDIGGKSNLHRPSSETVHDDVVQRACYAWSGGKGVLVTLKCLSWMGTIQALPTSNETVELMFIACGMKLNAAIAYRDGEFYQIGHVPQQIQELGDSVRAGHVEVHPKNCQVGEGRDPSVPALDHQRQRQVMRL